MFNPSNFYNQARNLPAENEFQLITLRAIDAVIFSREISKCLTVASLIALTSSLVLNANSTISLTGTVVFGISWFVSKQIAKKVEPYAESMIQYFKDSKNETHSITNLKEKELKLID